MIDIATVGITLALNNRVSEALRDGSGGGYRVQLAQARTQQPACSAETAIPGAVAAPRRAAHTLIVRWLERGIPDLAPCFAAFGRALDATPTQPAGYPTGSTEHDGWRFAEMGMHTG